MATASVARPMPSHESVSPVHSAVVGSKTASVYITLPDLVSDCTFPVTYHPDGDRITADSTNWLVDGCPELSPRRKNALRGLQAGALAAYCYPSCPPERLRVVADFLGYLFHLDNISDGMMTKETDVLADVVMNAHWFPEQYMPCKNQPAEEISAGKLARDYWARCITDAGPAMQHRFKETLAQFFEAVNLQAQDRDADVIPDLESFIDIRRDTSGCKPVYDLVEYSLGLDLPDEVVENPIIEALKLASNDLVAWSNDIFSYNVEQSRGDDTHNLIPIFMAHYGMDVQEAFNKVGELCSETMHTFAENLKLVPSFGDEQLDKDVQLYIRGLQDWISGSLHWSFKTERYFGKHGEQVKRTRTIKLMKKRIH